MLNFSILTFMFFKMKSSFQSYIDLIHWFISLSLPYFINCSFCHCIFYFLVIISIKSYFSHQRIQIQFWQETLILSSLFFLSGFDNRDQHMQLSYCRFYFVVIASSKFNVPQERFCSFRWNQHIVMLWSGLIQINNKIEIFNQVFVCHSRKD